MIPKLIFLTGFLLCINNNFFRFFIIYKFGYRKANDNHLDEISIFVMLEYLFSIITQTANTVYLKAKQSKP